MGSSRSRAGNRNVRRERKRHNHDKLIQAALEDFTTPPTKPTRIILKPLTDKQRQYDKSIRANVVTFGTGPAGTGKTWYAAMMFADMIKQEQIKRLIITRPAVEAGESLGFLPGELDEKFDPYFRPVREALQESFGSSHLEYLVKAGVIEARPLGLIRGATWKDCAVIFDEAQNATKTQMKMFLTRIGENCKVVVNGDIQQRDIAGVCGLEDAIKRLSGVEGARHIHFEKADIVRSGFCQAVVEAYDDKVEEDRAGLERALSA